MEQHYGGGSNAALAAFGLTKIAIFSAADKLKILQANRAKPKGMSGIAGAAGDANLAQMKPSTGGFSPGRAPIALPEAGGPMHVEQGFGGGPGMAAGFGGSTVPLQTPPPFALSGVGVTPSAAAPVRTTPVNLPTRLASLRLPWPE
jgi:hypothetical protein